MTVTGGDITEINWYAIHGKVPGYKWPYHTFKKEWGLDVDGSTTFPVMPWSNYDQNGDGDYDDWRTGDLSLYVYGRVKIGSLGYYLEEKYIDVVEDETTTVSWTLDVTKGTLYGTATVVGETPVRFDLMGRATIGDDEVSLYKHHAGTMSYSVDVESATWEVYPRYQFWDLDETGARTSSTWLIMSDVADTVTVAPDTSVEHDFYIEPGYVSGTFDLWGANTDLYQVQVDGILAGTTGIDAWTQSKTEDYELILCEGDWFIGVPDVIMWFDYDTSTSDIDYDFSYLRYRDYYQRDYGDPLTVEAGESYEQDYSFGTATVTLNYQIAGGGKLFAPDIRFVSKDYTVHDQGYVTQFGYGKGSDDLVTEGQATITVLGGKHDITASAFAEDGSYTRFGRFWIEVEPGDVIVADLDAPDLIVTTPTGLQHFSSSSVTVAGTATDDVEVDSITVNGVPVTFTSTNNPGDPNEVEFSTTVSGLSYGENTITIIATDTSDKSTSVGRTIIRDNDPPVIDAFSVLPSEPVKLGDLTTVSAEVSDPQGDALTTTIYWGDGSTTSTTDESMEETYEYTNAGVYT
ncbi:MAG: hypothetical protein KAQ96_04575, partial [Thermoplasmata archaeon]|nr:hypothetical protein [Thermoplasmata archaeon]